MVTVLRVMISSPSSMPVLRIVRPPSYWDVVGHHAPLALATGIALAASRFLPVQRLPLKFCLFSRGTGYPCPFCGMTRTFVAMAHAQWSAAWHNSPLAAGLFILTGLTFLWHALALAFGVRVVPGPALRPGPRATRALLAGGALLVLLNWAYRLHAGLK